MRIWRTTCGFQIPPWAEGTPSRLSGSCDPAGRPAVTGVAIEPLHDRDELFHGFEDAGGGAVAVWDAAVDVAAEALLLQLPRSHAVADQRSLELGNERQLAAE
jgi:hypothetical protein